MSRALTRASAGELAFGGVLFRREGDDGLVVELTMKQKDGSTRTHVLRFRKKAL